MNREHLIRRYEHNYFRGYVVSTKRRGSRLYARYFSDNRYGRCAAFRAAPVGTRNFFTKAIRRDTDCFIKTIRHTVNVPSEMEPLLSKRIQDFRSLSGYFVSLGFTDMLYLPKRPIAKAFANASWQQQHRAIENILTLRKEGWRGVDLQPHLDAVTQVENVAIKCLKKGDWLLDHIEGELAFMRGADFRR